MPEASWAFLALIRDGLVLAKQGKLLWYLKIRYLQLPTLQTRKNGFPEIVHAPAIRETTLY